MNTKISYQYRSQDDYIESGAVVLPGVPRRGIEHYERQLRACLIDRVKFIAEQVGLPEMFPWVTRGEEIRGTDHCYHELLGIRATAEPANMNLCPETLLLRAKNLRALRPHLDGIWGWQPFDPYARAEGVAIEETCICGGVRQII